MNNTERDALRRARRVPAKRKTKSKRNIKKHVYERSVLQSLITLVVMVFFLFKFSFDFDTLFTLVPVILILAMIADVIYMFSTPLVNISTKKNTIYINRNLFFRKKFELSQIMWVSFDNNGDNGGKIILSDKNYKRLGRFYFKEMGSSDVIRFIQDIEGIVKTNNPEYGAEEVKLEQEPKKVFYQRVFINKKYRRTFILPISLTLLLVLSFAIHPIADNIISTDADNPDSYSYDYDDYYDDGYYDSSDSYDNVTEKEEFVHKLYRVRLASPFLLFILIWLLAIPLITIENNFIHLKRFPFIKKSIFYYEIERIETISPNKIALYGKSNMLITKLNIITMQKNKKEDFKNTLNQIVEENKIAN